MPCLWGVEPDAMHQTSLLGNSGDCDVLGQHQADEESA